MFVVLHKFTDYIYGTLTYEALRKKADSLSQPLSYKVMFS